jgi:oligopeptidase A
VLGGAELQGDAKARFAAIQEEHAARSQAFSEHVMDATDAYSLLCPTWTSLTGVPEDVLNATRAAAAAEGKEGHKLTLHMPCYLPVMQYASNRALREALYRAYATRASEFGPAERDNTPLMTEILGLRQEEARLLGYASFAEVSLVPKMADNPAQVMHFLRDLAQRARPYAEKDMAELRDFARTELRPVRPASLGCGLRERKAQGSPIRLQRPGGQTVLHRAHRAGKGLFGLIEKLFDVQIQARQCPGLARIGALLPHRAGGPTDRPVLPRPLCPQRQAPRRLDGRRAWPLDSPRHPDYTDPRGPPGVQLRQGRGRQARAAHPRRRHHPVP